MSRIKKIMIIVVVLIVIIPIITIMASVDLMAIKNIDETSFVAIDDISSINKNEVYGKGVRVSLEKDDLAVGEDKYKTGKLIFKLFGLIPIKEIEVFIVSDELLFLGGTPLGFAINTEGVLIVGTNSVNTEEGLVNNLSEIDIKKGDILKKINGQKISSVEDAIQKISDNEHLDLEIKRGDQIKVLRSKTAIDADSGKRKLGIWIRDDASGIGTLTYVKSDNYQYGALGHSLSDSETGAKIDIENGSVFPCSVIGIEKSENGNPGSLKGVFLKTKNAKGTIDSGSPFGVFGRINDTKGVVDENRVVSIASRLSVKPGKAKIASSVSGVLEEYDIEIVKASKQSSAKDKSMVIRVTDKRLLALTGGIVQGMSGSPILQKGKIVGALTHVFVSDPTKGYAIYLDWMLLN